jgi:hypothetical protein
MHRKTILIVAFLLVVGGCKKESRTGKAAAGEDYLFPLDEVKSWYRPQKGITVDWEAATHHQGKTGEYWLVGIGGRPTFAKLRLGYRRLLFFKNNKDEITEQILEIIPDALYLQRVQTVSGRDFTGRVFIFDRDYALTGGLTYQNGVRVGTIKTAVADTGKLHVDRAPVTCVWLDNNYIDSNGELVVYAEQICDPMLDGGGGMDMRVVLRVVLARSVRETAPLSGMVAVAAVQVMPLPRRLQRICRAKASPALFPRIL